MAALKDQPVRRIAIALNWRLVYYHLRSYEDWRTFGIEPVLTHSPFIADFLSWSMGLSAHVFTWGINPRLYYLDQASKIAQIVYIQRKQNEVEELN